MRLLWEDRAWSDYLYWQTQDKISGMWSRRIDDTNRIVYFEKDEIVYIVSCKGHYDE